MNEVSSVRCERIAEEMASVLDGSAPAELLDHVADCDECRDARHDAERAALLLSEAGRDFQLPPGLALDLISRPAAPTNAPVPPAASAIPSAAAHRRQPAALLLFDGNPIPAGPAGFQLTRACSPPRVSPVTRFDAEPVS